LSRELNRNVGVIFVALLKHGFPRVKCSGVQETWTVLSLFPEINSVMTGGRLRLVKEEEAPRGDR
jgi:hypothetical protein